LGLGPDGKPITEENDEDENASESAHMARLELFAKDLRHMISHDQKVTILEEIKKEEERKKQEEEEKKK